MPLDLFGDSFISLLEDLRSEEITWLQYRITGDGVKEQRTPSLIGVVTAYIKVEEREEPTDDISGASVPDFVPRLYAKNDQDIHEGDKLMNRAFPFRQYEVKSIDPLLGYQVGIVERVR